jgi:hypothetical protein
VSSSKWTEALANRELSTHEKGRIAEAAIMFRLAVYGYQVFNSFWDGTKSDLIVDKPGMARPVRIQVKCAVAQSHSNPLAYLRCSQGRGKFRKYTKEEVDFIAVYDMNTDTAYVYSWAEVEGKSTITVRERNAELWSIVAL